MLGPGCPLAPVGARVDNEGMDAPRGSVEVEGTDELGRLRRRAYGPDADIAGDAVAQARLSELEDAQRRELSPVVDAVARGRADGSERVPVSDPVEGRGLASTSGKFSERDPDRRTVSGQHTAEGSIPDSGPMGGPVAAPWWRRRWLVILGVAIAALALFAAGAGMSQLIGDGSTPIPTETATATAMAEMPRSFSVWPGPGSYVPAPDYVLALKSVGEDADPSIDPNGTLDGLGIDADQVRRYEDFQSLGVWSGESSSGMTCLFVGPLGERRGQVFSYAACSLAGMDVISDHQIHGRDSLTRFVLKGDQVHVYEYEVGADPYASQG